MIPKKIHQIYGMWDKGSLPEEYVTSSNILKRCNPDFEYKLWSKRELTNFIFKQYPNYSRFYLDLPSDIHRGDVARYFLLHHFGGLYCDLDVKCLRSLDGLIHNKALLGEESYKEDRLLECSFMMSESSLDIWLEVIDNCKTLCKKTLNPVRSTGPYSLEILRNNPDVTIFDEEKMKTFISHRRKVSWKQPLKNQLIGSKIP